MKIQMRGTVRDSDGTRWYLCVTGEGNLREFSLLPDSPAGLVAVLMTAAGRKDTIEIDATEIDRMRKPGEGVPA